MTTITPALFITPSLSSGGCGGTLAITATIGITGTDSTEITTRFNSGYRCSNNKDLLHIIANNGEDNDTADPWGNPMIFCAGTISAKGEIAGYEVPNRKIAIYFSDITLKNTTDICTAGSGNFVCNNGAAIF